MAELIASGTTEASSSDITVTAGVPVTLFLKDAAGPLVARGSRAVVQIKDSGGGYFTIGELDRSRPALVIDGPGTFRVTRLANSAAFGVDQG